MSDNPAQAIAESPVQTMSKKSKKEQDPKAIRRYRMMIFGRFLLAIVGGYLLAVNSMAVLPKFFDNELKVHATLAGTMLTFVVYCAVFIWVFLVQSTVRAWLCVAVPCIIFWAINYFI